MYFKFLEGNENSQQAFLSNNTKEGKQKIEDLLKKHQNNVYALDQNLTKEQLKDYEKGFKKLGVDFSVTKNGKDNYSFFFSAGQSNVIEKALKNVVELKSAVLENEKVKSAENALDSLKDNMSLESVDKVKNVFDEIHQIIRQGYPYFKRVKGDNPTVSRGGIVVCDSSVFPFLASPFSIKLLFFTKK